MERVSDAEPICTSAHRPRWSEIGNASAPLPPTLIPGPRPRGVAAVVRLLCPRARSLREQVDWDVVRRMTDGNVFAAALLVVFERLEVIEGESP
ncbi:hypothetical protein GCM10027053_05540 [Intrasporangium mesophilum]